MTDNAIATADQASTELAIAGEQTRFTDVQVAALRQIGIEDAADADLDVFFHHAKRTGLDPFARQIYMIGRETDVKVRVPTQDGGSRIEVQRMTKFTIQVGIDGYRLLGKRAAIREGVLVTNDDPQWCGKDGAWRDFWLRSDGTPVAAKYTIRVDGAPHTAVCMFEEFAQYSGRGELTSMWKKMPANQLAKCAETQAWRKAFPADFAGLEPDGTNTTHVVVDQDGAPVRRVRSQRRGVEGLREAIAEREPVVLDAEPEPPTEVDGQPVETEMATRAQVQKLAILLKKEGFDDNPDGRAGRLDWISSAIERRIDSSKEVTKAEASDLIDLLERSQQPEGN
jgi:phage recombination protein Bet